MRFLIDAQLPPSLARWMASRGHVAEHVARVMTPTVQDSGIVRYAAENGAVIVTKDFDFLTLADARFAAKPSSRSADMVRWRPTRLACGGLTWTHRQAEFGDLHAEARRGEGHGHEGVILQMLAHVRKLVTTRDLGRLQLAARPDAREHQEVRGADRPGR